MHGLNGLARDLVSLSEGEASGVFVDGKGHDYFTTNRKLLMPAGLGYTPGTGGPFELVDAMRDETAVLAQRHSDNEEILDYLASVGFNSQNLVAGYNHACEQDKNSIEKRSTISKTLIYFLLVTLI